MKAKRVYITLSVFGLLILGFFFLPLPVSRVRETGLVAVHPDAVEAVLLPEPARMTTLNVGPGQKIGLGDRVPRGWVLGEFKSEALEIELGRAEAIATAQYDRAKQLDLDARSASIAGDEKAEQQLIDDAKRARETAATYETTKRQLLARKETVGKLKSPRDGVLLIAPRRDDLHKLFDKGYTETTPVFAVGDPTRLIVKVPVTPPDYRLLKTDLEARGELDVSVFVKGRTDRTFTGKVRQLPAQNAATVPLPLTQRGGGSLAVKPSEDPNLLIPLAQVYLVEVELSDPDIAVDPGQLTSVKIHTKWRSGAWWVARAISNALDLGFY